MGFAIWAADDPELKRQHESDGTEDYPLAESSGYPYFSVSNVAMRDLRIEMEAQGFGIVYAFIFNDGDVVTSQEIDLALERSSEIPTTIHDPEGIKLWRDWLAFLRLASREHGGVEVQ